MSGSSLSSGLNPQIQQDLQGDHNQVIGQAVSSSIMNVSGSSSVNVFQFSAEGLPQFEVSPQSSRKEVPSLLPYLPNRREQEEELEKAIQGHLQGVSRNPLVCIIHGDEFQSHERFLERIKKRSLPIFIGLDINQTNIKDCILCWPSEKKKMDNLEARFCKDLAEKFLRNNSATTEEINQALCNYPGSVIIRTHLLTEDWHNQGFIILDRILKFWQNWPELNHETRLIVFLSIKYQTKYHKNINTSTFNYFFNYLKNFFRLRHYQRANRKIREQLHALSKSNFERFNRLSGVVLPELMEISQGQVENWVRDEVKHFLGEEVIGALIEAVEKIFNSWENERTPDKIPMSILAEKLTSLLTDLIKKHKDLL
jgi:inactive STAND